MNRKGFTLVEVLSVIIILALLIVITSISVTFVMNRIKKEAFKTNVKRMIEESKNNFFVDSNGLSSDDSFIYSNENKYVGNNSQKLVNNANYNYKVKLQEKDGKIVGYYAINNEKYSTYGVIPYDNIVVYENDDFVDSSYIVFDDNEIKNVLEMNASDYANIPCGEEIREKGYVTYEDFYAVGDGKTNDAFSIYYAHECANRLNIPVRTLKETYYISSLPVINNKIEPIKIATNVDWNNATIIIDDSNLSLEERKTSVFNISHKYIAYQEELNLNYSSSTNYVNEIVDLIKKKNSNEINYYVGLVSTTDKINRSTGNDNNIFQSFDKSDFFKIDKYGKILNKLRYNFNGNTKVYVQEIPNEPLYLKNVNFKTKVYPCDKDKSLSSCKSVARDFRISRCNVIIDNMNHYLLNNDVPNYYGTGFLSALNVSDLIIKNSRFSAHKYKRRFGDSQSTGGTYDISMANITNLTFDNVGYVCESNIKDCYIKNMLDITYNGIIGNNNIKNWEINNCFFNRIDSHQPAENVLIKNSILGHFGLHFTGSGQFKLLNSSIDSAEHVIFLRADYGGTWNGNIEVNNIYFNTRNYKGLYPTAPRIFYYNTTNLFNVENGGFGYQLFVPSLNISNIFFDEKNLVSSYKAYNGQIYTSSPGIILAQNSAKVDMNIVRMGNVDKSTMVGDFDFYNIRSVTFDKLKINGVFLGNNLKGENVSEEFWPIYKYNSNGIIKTDYPWGVERWNRNYFYTNTKPINMYIDTTSLVSRNYTDYYEGTYYEGENEYSGDNAINTITNSDSHPYCFISVDESIKDDWYINDILHVKLEVPDNYEIVDYGLGYNTNSYVKNYNMVIPSSKKGVFNIYGFIKDSNGKKYDCIKLIKKNSN